MVFDLDERLHATARLPQDGHDLRDATVRELQRRFMVDAAGAARLARRRVALRAGASRAPWPRARRELLWACALHEMGMMVSHHDHHRHSAYLLAHVDAPGFSQSQQRRVAELVLGQRGGLRKVETGLTQEAFAWQVLARGGDHQVPCARRRAARGGAALARDGMQARLTFDAAWAAAHPHASTCCEELQAWARGGC